MEESIWKKCLYVYFDNFWLKRGQGRWNLPRKVLYFWKQYTKKRTNMCQDDLKDLVFFYEPTNACEVFMHLPTI